MDKKTKQRMVTQRLNKKLDDRIRQQQEVFDLAEIDMEVSKRLDNPEGVERHKEKMANAEAEIKRLEAMKE